MGVGGLKYGLLKLTHNFKSYFYVKMKVIKPQNAQERKAYIPAGVKVIEVTAHRVLCQSNLELDEFSPIQGDEL